MSEDKSTSAVNQDRYLDPEHVFYRVGEEVGCDEERAIAYMLLEGVLFISGQDFIAPWGVNEKTCAIVVNCNDVFWWATADAEALPNSEIENLYKMWKANLQYGSDKWCCLRRKLRPQVPLVEMMKKDGYWDAELEALPAPEPS